MFCGGDWKGPVEEDEEEEESNKIHIIVHVLLKGEVNIEKIERQIRIFSNKIDSFYSNDLY